MFKYTLNAVPKRIVNVPAVGGSSNIVWHKCRPVESSNELLALVKYLGKQNEQLNLLKLNKYIKTSQRRKDAKKNSSYVGF